MFSKQCQLLIRLEHPSELTNRSLKFIHNTIHELRLLEVSVLMAMCYLRSLIVREQPWSSG